jgi:hypothetical protein
VAGVRRAAGGCGSMAAEAPQRERILEPHGKNPESNRKSNRPIVGVFFRVVTKTCDGFS